MPGRSEVASGVEAILNTPRIDNLRYTKAAKSTITMQLRNIVLLAAAASVDAAATLRFSCSQLVVERLDPLVKPPILEDT